MNRLRLIIVTGLSGAGKSTALRVFEDLGYYCVDNLPSFLLLDLLNRLPEQPDIRQLVAVGMDVRDASFTANYSSIIASLPKDIDHQLLFVEADDAVLVRRFSEVRRPHPLAGDGTVLDGIKRERDLLAGLRSRAGHCFDTGSLAPLALRNLIKQRCGGVDDQSADRLRVSLLSFGFKHGTLLEADLIFDVRFLPNPHYVPDLRPLTGLTSDVANYALDNDDARRFLDLLEQMLNFLVPLYKREGKASLTVGIGCTGGRHRSVAVVEALQRRLAANEEAVVMAIHRQLAAEEVAG